MDDALCGDPPRHRRAAWILHAGHRLASSDEWTPARRLLWGSELPRVFAGKVITASGLQRSPRRGRDEGDGAMGETCDHLWRQVQFLGNIQKSDVRNAMTDRPPNARKSHLAPAPAQRAKRGSVTPLRGLMTVSFTPR